MQQNMGITFMEAVYKESEVCDILKPVIL